MKTLERIPSENFDVILNWARIFSTIVGVNILNPNYRINLVTYIVITSIVGYFVFTISTIVDKFEENWTFMLEAMCMLGSVFQGISKLATGLVNCKKMLALVNTLREIYAEYEKKGPTYRKVLFDNCANTRKVLVVLVIIYLSGGVGLVGLPLMIMLVNGKRYLIMHFHLPGMSVETDFGYWCTFGSHSVCVLAAMFGLLAADVFVLIYVLHYYLFVDILKLKIEELNMLLENAENRFKTEVNAALDDIAQFHQMYTNFTVRCDEALYFIISTQVSTAGISMVLTIFVLLTAEWPGGYNYLVIAATSLYVYCLLGTKIEICNEEFEKEIYNMSWYNMTVSQQKMVRFMLMQSQAAKTITVGGVVPLSVSTALQITKTIYSITMMMVQFLVE